MIVVRPKKGKLTEGDRLKLMCVVAPRVETLRMQHFWTWCMTSSFCSLKCSWFREKPNSSQSYRDLWSCRTPDKAPSDSGPPSQWSPHICPHTTEGRTGLKVSQGHLHMLRSAHISGSLIKQPYYITLWENTESVGFLKTKNLKYTEF